MEAWSLASRHSWFVYKPSVYLPLQSRTQCKTCSAERTRGRSILAPSVSLCTGTALAVFYKRSDPVCWWLVLVSSVSPAVWFRWPNKRGVFFLNLFFLDCFFFLLLGSLIKWLLSHCSLVTLHCHSPHPCLEETVARQEEAPITQAISLLFVWAEHAWFPSTVSVKRALKFAPMTGSLGCEEGRFKLWEGKNKTSLKRPWMLQDTVAYTPPCQEVEPVCLAWFWFCCLTISICLNQGWWYTRASWAKPLPFPPAFQGSASIFCMVWRGEKRGWGWLLSSPDCRFM